MPVVSREVHLVERPEGMPTPRHFRIVESEVPEPGPGQVRVQNLYMSVDPAMRPAMSNGQTPLNQAMGGGAIGRVTDSAVDGLQAGDLVQHRFGFRERFVADSNALSRLAPHPDVPLTAHMHVLGGTGFVAYGGLLHIGQLKEGETVFVSTAAGAVGSVAVQVAKIKGCRVIGSAGSDEKCRWLSDELGCDVAINYKTRPIRQALKDAAPDGLDVYFDNVGGEHLNAALPRMNVLGRIPVCGMISAYNNRGAVSDPVTTLSNIIYRRVTIRGFVAADFPHLRRDFQRDMSAWLGDGRVRYRETVMQGIDQAPAAIIGLLNGENVGKMLVRLAD